MHELLQEGRKRDVTFHGWELRVLKKRLHVGRAYELDNVSCNTEGSSVTVRTRLLLHQYQQVALPLHHTPSMSRSQFAFPLSQWML